MKRSTDKEQIQKEIERIMDAKVKKMKDKFQNINEIESDFHY